MKAIIDNEQLDSENILSCSYEDYAGGRADSLTITLVDPNKLWRNSAIKKATAIQVSNELVDSGKMYISELSYSANICTIRALSTSSLALNEVTYMRNKITIEEMIKEVAHELNIGYKAYGLEPYVYSIVERINEKPTSYLIQRLLLEGYLGKIWNDTLIIYKEKEFENKESVKTVQEEDFIQEPGFSTTSNELVSYVENCYGGIVTRVKSGLDGKTIKRNIPVDTANESERFCNNIMRLYNKNEYSGSIVVSGLDIVASNVITLDGNFGVFAGNNFVHRVSHNMLNDTKKLYFRKPIEGEY